jgi:hypothetical protein
VGLGRPGCDHPGEELRRLMMEQCHQSIQKLMPLMDETAPKDILDGILKVQQQQMKLAGLLQGSGGISVSVGSGDSDEILSCVSRPMRRCFALTSPVAKQLSSASSMGSPGATHRTR